MLQPCLPLADFPGDRGDAMGMRFPRLGLQRRFRTDIQVLFCRRIRGGPSLSQRALALDRIAGSCFLLCVVLSMLWLAGRSMLPASPVGVPEVAVSAQAASAPREPDAPPPGAAVRSLAETQPQARVVEAVSQPIDTDEIIMLQSRLKSLGFDPGRIDGIAGPRTLAALNRYRAARLLSEVSRIDRATAGDLLD